MYVTFLTGLQGDCPQCKHAPRHNKFQKEAAQQVSPCKPLPFDILSMYLYMSWVVSKLLEQQCNWRLQNRRQGPQKETMYYIQFIPPKKTYVCFLTLLNVWGLVWQELQCYRTRNASLVRLYYTCFYLCSVRIVCGQISKIFYWDRTQRRRESLNVSLADLIRCCPFTQGHSDVFRFLVVFILRFVKTGTPTLLSFPNIWLDPAP